MLHPLILAGIIGMPVSLSGDITAGGGDYVEVPFTVPEGTVEIQISHTDNSDRDILDWGVWDQAGFRGWGGGLTDDAIIGVDEASRGYLPGPIQPGPWMVEIGKAKIASASVHYDITVTFRDAPTLTPVRPRAAWRDRVLERGARWYQGDFHVHSIESGDATATFDQIRDLARARGLDFVNLSDHNTISQHALVAAYQDGVSDLLFLRGTEVTTYGGHANAVGNQVYVDHRIGLDGWTIQDLVDAARDSGAIFIVNHPKLDLGTACIGCAWTYGDDTPWDQVAGIELSTGAYINAPVFEPSVLAMWDGLLDQGFHITGTGGSDDHRATTDPGPGDSQIGTPTTVVWADELSQPAIMKGVEEGHVVVKLRGPDDPMLELDADTDMGETGMIGDTVAGGRVTLTAHAVGAKGLALELWRNGAVDETLQVDTDDFTASFERDTREQGDRYRAQLVEAFDVVITNPIWVEYAQPVDEGSGGCGCRVAARVGGADGAGRGVPVAVLTLVVFVTLCWRSRRSGGNR